MSLDHSTSQEPTPSFICKHHMSNHQISVEATRGKTSGGRYQSHWARRNELVKAVAAMLSANPPYPGFVPSQRCFLGDCLIVTSVMQLREEVFWDIFYDPPGDGLSTPVSLSSFDLRADLASISLPLESGRASSTVVWSAFRDAASQNVLRLSAEPGFQNMLVTSYVPVGFEALAVNADHNHPAHPARSSCVDLLTAPAAVIVKYARILGMPAQRDWTSLRSKLLQLLASRYDAIQTLFESTPELQVLLHRLDLADPLGRASVATLRRSLAENMYSRTSSFAIPVRFNAAGQSK